MKHVFTTSKIGILCCLLVIAVTASAWQFKSKKQPKSTTASANVANEDTTHPGQHSTVQDDYGLNALDENLKNIQFNFSGLDTAINMAVKQALANINFKEIGQQVHDAMDKIDWPQIQATVNKSVNEAMEQVKKIDWNEINRSIHSATDELNSEEFRKQLNGAELQKTINDALENAFSGIEKIRPEIMQGKEFIDQLDKNGLIDKSKGYKIEWTDGGDLIINGRKQAKDIADKYRRYYKKGGYSINIDGDNTESL
ncbi:MAG TPA: hypothetical protein VHB48_01870 [Chitinophagaceae bacterium]|nr:hypothetical protein [Chitinophagaceae bacterium]